MVGSSRVMSLDEVGPACLQWGGDRQARREYAVGGQATNQPEPSPHVEGGQADAA
jgi:hypothetical protein